MKLNKKVIALTLTFTLSMMGIFSEAAFAKAQPVSKSVVLTLRVIPSADLDIEKRGIDKEAFSLDSKDLPDRDLKIGRIQRDGQEMIMITRISE